MSTFHVVLKHFCVRTFRCGIAVTFVFQIVVDRTIRSMVCLLASITYSDKHNDLSSQLTDYTYQRLQVCEDREDQFVAPY